MTPATKEPAAKPRITQRRVGEVTSDGRSKTRTVVYRFMTRHPKYGKFMRHETALQVHDDKNQSKLGDTVEVEACRPLSKTKSWRLVRVIDRKPS